MAERVTGKIKEMLATDPLGRSPDGDPWREFRRVEIIDLKLDFRFRHSLGKCSRFFLELEKRRLLATRCGRCGTVWMPPRPACGNDLAVTEWIELSGHGTLAAATECAVTLPTAAGQDRLVLGYVALDGASTLLLQRIRNFGDVRRLTAGLSVQVVWAKGEVAHPMELFWFEPAE